MAVEIEYTYQSPRWTGEITDCSMPLTFDTYSVCSFNCLYCFSFFQRSHSSTGYLKRRIKAVNPKRIEKILHNIFNENYNNLTKSEKQFIPYFKNRYVLQWGGLSDGFDYYEQQFGVSLELLKIFDKYDYPLSISTKGVFFVDDDRYMDLIKKHSHNWHWKISIITTDEKKAKYMERGVPSPKERFRAIKKLADTGAHVTLRYRPYIIGLSDDWEKAFRIAKKNGADSVTTEFFCLELRADDRLKKRYAEMSRILGYDIVEAYKKTSVGSSYLRLNYDLKTDIICNMREVAHNLDMRFYVSDAHHKEKSDYTCCCGVPPDWKVYKGQYAEALLKAKEKGSVKWSDIESEASLMFNSIKYREAVGFNTSGSVSRAKFRKMSFLDYLKNYWNDPEKEKSPYRYFQGVIVPKDKDEEGNIVYEYDYTKTKCSGCKGCSK